MPRRSSYRERDVIILENGTTVSRMAESLGAFTELTVLTNGIDTMNLFRPFVTDRRTMVCGGGMLREVSGTFVGSLAEQFFANHHADTLFISALGFTAEDGFTDPNLMDTQVKKAMIQASNKVVMILDSSKIGSRFFTAVAQLSDIDVFVTRFRSPRRGSRVNRKTAARKCTSYRWINKSYVLMFIYDNMCYIMME